MPEKPTIEQLRAIAESYGMRMSDADLNSFLGLMGGTLESYRRIDQFNSIAECGFLHSQSVKKATEIMCAR
ncbi:MAG TPA: hypothetical protein VKV40_22620 [Ktedonobacteraceae bacterium]|nr:hypothetical protein [Ktedonobacteraceae bacterium]